MWGADPATPEGARLEVLLTLVDAYEETHHPMPRSDPVSAITFMMDQRGLTRRDLEPMIGSRARVAEVLNRKRALTLPMIRRLSEGLGIPADILVRAYPTRDAARGARPTPPTRSGTGPVTRRPCRPGCPTEARPTSVRPTRFRC